MEAQVVFSSGYEFFPLHHSSQLTEVWLLPDATMLGNSQPLRLNTALAHHLWLSVFPLESREHLGSSTIE